MWGERAERLTPEARARAVEWMDALREAVGREFKLLVDAHGRFDVASAIQAAHALEHVDLVWLEEPIHVESDFQVSVATPNLYRQECLHTWFPDMAQIVTPMLDVREGAIYPNGRPGLGIELNVDGVNACRIESIGGVAITDHLEGDLED